MITSDPHDVLVLVHERTRHLREELAAEHAHRRRPWTHRVLGASLRRAANHLDPAPFAHRVA